MLRSAVLLTLLLVSGSVIAEPPPSWVQQNGTDPDTYPAARFLTGYGLSSPGGSEAEQRQQALAMAREALVSSIRTSVRSEFTSRVTQRDQQMSHYAQNVVRTKANLELDGLDTLLTWREPRKNLTHALAVLDKQRTLALLDEKLARQATECTQAFEAARRASDAAGLLHARQLRESMEEGFLVHAVLSGRPRPTVSCPSPSAIAAELRRVYQTAPGLDRFVALAALDLGLDLPKGIRVLMDRITFADTPFCGTLSAYLEQALAGQLATLGQVKILDKALGNHALRAGQSDDLGEALQAQAAVRGNLFDLGEEVKLALRVTSATGEELATASVLLPAALLRKAELKLVPDNYEEARKALAICDAQVQDSKLQVKLSLDRGAGGIYRQGDRLHLFLKANMDCYIKILYHQVDGTQVLIFPNKFHPDPRIQKNRLYQIPPDDNSFNLEVQEPFGAEMVKVIASTDPIDLQGKAPDANGLSEVQESLQGILLRTRGISLKKAETQYAEATTVVNTMAGSK